MVDSHDPSITSRNIDKTERLTVDEAINQITRVYFYPAIYGSGFLKTMSLLVVLLGLLLPVLLLIPAVQTSLSCEYLHINKGSDLLRPKYILELVSANVKILMLLALGGAIVKTLKMDPSERVGCLMKNIEKRADEYIMSKRPGEIQQKMNADIKKLLNQVQQIRDEATIGNLFNSIVSAKAAMWQLYELYRSSQSDISKYYLYFMIVGPFVYFPGGFYGFLAFVLFLIDNLTSVGKIYVTYLPEISAC